MISETEYVIIRAFDKTLADNTAMSQAIIDRKNALLVRADKRIVELERALATERARNIQGALARQLASERRH